MLFHVTRQTHGSDASPNAAHLGFAPNKPYVLAACESRSPMPHSFHLQPTTLTLALNSVGRRAESAPAPAGLFTRHTSLPTVNKSITLAGWIEPHHGRRRLGTGYHRHGEWRDRFRRSRFTNGTAAAGASSATVVRQ
jgi:hypothetical protein